ncbi:MAG: hypothetical protein V3V14_14810 [Saprospiraceae bacterium]
MTDIKPKSFWKKPEGVTGALFLGGIIFGAGYLLFKVGAIATAAFLSSAAGMVIGLLTLGLIIFMGIDPKTRTLISYMYKSAMRWITGMFVQINPIAILKSYVDDLKDNLRKMNRQVSKLRGQMHVLKEMIFNNKKEIKSNMTQASKAKIENNNSQLILKSRKAARLKESNIKLEALYRKMEVLYRVLGKMYENSAILVEDIQDQVQVKEIERKALLAGHSAMKSAMNVIKGDHDKKAMFDAALEAIADDVSNKVGEMERFMDMSETFMQSVDLQNGIFEDEGLKMLEKWEKESTSLLLGDSKDDLILQANNDEDILDLNHPVKEVAILGRENQYDDLFD